MEHGGNRLLGYKVITSPLTPSSYILSEQNTIVVHIKYSDGKILCDLGFVKIKIKNYIRNCTTLGTRKSSTDISCFLFVLCCCFVVVV